MSEDRLGNLNSTAPDTGEEIVRKGLSASPGIVIGTVFLKDSETLVVPQHQVDAADTPDEIARFEDALKDTRAELNALRENIAEYMGDDHARIFDAHLLILDDITVTDGTRKVISEARLNAAAAFEQVINKVIRSFSQIDDEYLQDRFVDVKDVKRRIIRHLLGKEKSFIDRPLDPSVIVAHDLSPSDTAQLGRKNVLGYVTDLGGRTSHVAIMARSQGLPAVVGLDNLFAQVRNGDRIIIDGNTGTIVVNPTDSTITDYEYEIKHFKELEEQLLTLTGYPAITKDDKEFQIAANLDMPDEVDSVLEYGGQGIGLFRTEYFFISHEFLPSEQAQFEMYKLVAKKMGDKPVVFRTLDIGGDKIASYLQESPELNPFMGWRGIRFCLTRVDIFKAQLRAIYRASKFGNVKIMFPMISQIEEVIRAKEICAEVRDELAADNIEFDPDVEIGIMIETPSAVAMADHLAKIVAFFSIGTNDLIQYTMAVDRGNNKIAHLYQNLHPSIIRFLKQSIEAAHKRNIPVSVCGEMCGDPLSVIVLIGLQVDQFSCSPNMMPEVKRIIRSVTVDECRALVRRVMRYAKTSEIEAEIQKFIDTKMTNGGGD